MYVKRVIVCGFFDFVVPHSTKSPCPSVPVDTLSNSFMTEYAIKLILAKRRDAVDREERSRVTSVSQHNRERSAALSSIVEQFSDCAAARSRIRFRDESDGTDSYEDESIRSRSRRDETGRFGSVDVTTLLDAARSRDREAALRRTNLLSSSRFAALQSIVDESSLRVDIVSSVPTNAASVSTPSKRTPMKKTTPKKK